MQRYRLRDDEMDSWREDLVWIYFLISILTTLRVRDKIISGEAFDLHIGFFQGIA
jgi:hypothetical protein